VDRSAGKAPPFMNPRSEMMSETKLDLKGLLCPMPVVKIAQAIKTVAVGESIEAVATDPGVLADIPAWARSTGNELVAIEKKDNKEFRFVVKRLK
jgi:tRNA 2-thiouridine synthesizing protein A